MLGQPYTLRCILRASLPGLAVAVVLPVWLVVSRARQWMSDWETLLT